MTCINSLFALLLVVSIYGCESCGKGTQGGDNSLKRDKYTTTINYQINVDEANKVKEEGNEVYYEVSLNTDVKITAIVTGSSVVEIHWDQTLNNIPGVLLNTTRGQGFTQTFHHDQHTENNKVTSEHISSKGEFWWSLASDHTMSVTVSGKPYYAGEPQEIKDKIINRDKVFIITWK